MVRSDPVTTFREVMERLTGYMILCDGAEARAALGKVLWPGSITPERL